MGDGNIGEGLPFCLSMLRTDKHQGGIRHSQNHSKRQCHAKPQFLHSTAQLLYNELTHLLVFAVGEAFSESSLRRIWSFVHIDLVNPKNHDRICKKSALDDCFQSMNSILHGMVDFPDFLGCSSPRTIRRRTQRLYQYRQNRPK